MMSTADEKIQKKIQEGLAAGWKRPVVLALPRALVRARLVYQVVQGKAMPEPPVDGAPAKPGFLVVAPAERAGEALKQHGGLGGSCLACQLAADNAFAEAWLVVVGRDKIS